MAQSVTNGAASSQSPALPQADLTQIRWRLQQLQDKRYPGGVVALGARPVWTGPPVIELADGSRAAIRLGTSVLAIRDALTERAAFDWVVVLTELGAELPTGVLEHLLPDSRVIGLDPWPTLRFLFRATRQEFTLLAPSVGGSRTQLAYAALRALGADCDDVGALPPAPGGVLTNDHLFAVLAKRAFGIDGEVGAHQFAVWSMDPAGAEHFSSWSASADPELTGQLLFWVASKIGRLGDVFVEVLRNAGPADIVPLGLVAALLDDTAATAAAFPAPNEALVRTRTLLEVHLGGHQLTEEQLIGWGNVATLALADVATDNDVLRRTEHLVGTLGATTLVGRSDVLPAGLAPRISRLAVALKDAALSPDDTDRNRVENAWADVIAHNESHADTRLAPRDVRVAAATIRLWRWRLAAAEQPTGLAQWVDYYRRELAWVDAAVNDAYTGALESVLAQFADSVVTAVRTRRAEQDRAFARLLAGSGAHRETGAHAPLYVEDVLDRIIAPIIATRTLALSDHVSRTPVLLVVADGMSAAVASEVVADALQRHRPQWQECRLVDFDVTAALAVMPTLTEFSRCSLFSGQLQRGQAGEEIRGFKNWLTSHGMAPTGKVLFHKGDLDAVSRGNALASEVRAAVEDTKHRPVVACVLNDIDDALDRSDPIGTTWDVSSFKHLDPLLNAAAAVGRIVVLLSDHGHVPERREQPSAQRGQQVSARYRMADGVDATAVPSDEVLVDGPRVLCDGHRAVLAVDEQVRYTALKAGYHGGASPAEAVIPISILVNGAIPEDLGLETAPLGMPEWWSAQPPVTPLPPSTGRVVPGSGKKKSVRSEPQTAALFDTETLTPAYDSPGVGRVTTGRDVVDELLRSPLFNQQFQTFGRYLKRPQVGALVREAIDAGGLLPLVKAAQLLSVKASRVSGAVSLVAQVLNTDGVEVLTINGTDLVLKQALMFEQFGVIAPGAGG
jgi:hypothetical protein